MLELLTTEAFEGLVAAQADRTLPVWIEPFGCRMASVQARRGAAEALATRVAERFGVAPPAGPRRAAAGDLAWIGTGPGAWLVASGPGGPSIPDLRDALAGLASVADQSGGLGLLRLGGPQAANLLARGVFLDLHETAFPPGSAAGSVLAHVGVTLWRLERDLFELAVPRSFAPAVAHWLAEATADVAGV